ncbi:MAG: hypothetical protein H7210_07335 [Pyrinomonadaceae bacterium]|nr:hypothetical protein [Phycisphaerales bacterium]
MASSPLTQQQIIDTYFIEHRAKMLDLASFLDRIDRARSGQEAAQEDLRVTALCKAAVILGDHKPERARRILELMSDPTTDPIPRAGAKGAIGVWPGAAPIAGGG